MKVKLTNRQLDVLNYIKKYIAEHGYPPAIREIGSALELSSPATVHSHLKKLEEYGYIKKTNSKFRTIEIVGINEYLDNSDKVIKVPLLGNISAGSLNDILDNPLELFDLPSYLVNNEKDTFVLKVSGDSMINKGIYNNDIVIVNKQSTAKNGDIVIAMNSSDEVTVKSFYKDGNKFRLQPENDSMEAIILDEVIILGKVIGLYRKF